MFFDHSKQLVKSSDSFEKYTQHVRQQNKNSATTERAWIEHHSIVRCKKHFWYVELFKGVRIDYSQCWNKS